MVLNKPSPNKCHKVSYFPAHGMVKWRDTDFPKTHSLVLKTMWNRCLYVSDDKTIHCGPCFHFCQLFYLMALKFCEMERSSVVVLLQLEAARFTWGRQERALGHLEAARCQEWSGLSKKGMFHIDDMISPFHILSWQLCTNFDRKWLFFRIHTIPKTL